MPRKPTDWQNLRALVNLSWLKLAAIVVLSGLASAGQAALVLLLVKLAISVAGLSDLGVPALEFELSLTQASALGVGIVILILGLEIVASHLVSRAAADAYTTVRRTALRSFLAAKWEVQAVDAEGHLQELLTSQAQRAATATLALTTGVIALVSFVVLTLAAFAVDFSAALLATVAVGGLLAISRPLTRSARRQSSIQTEANLELSEATAETVAHAREIRLFGVAPQIGDALDELIARSSTAYYRNRILFRLAPVLFRAGATAIALLTILLVANVAQGRLDTVGAAVLILLRALGYAQGVQGAYHQLGEVAPWLESLRHKIDAYRQHADAAGSHRVSSFREIVFDDVSFTYPRGETPALRGVTLSITHGEAIGLVGPSGSGKTSLIQILLQMYEPDRGRVLVDGVPLSTTSRHDWRSLVAFVPQESYVARGTVADAIRFHRQGFSDEAVEAAARAAHADRFISELPLGYASQVGPRSEGFSGGQRQRLSIARALLGRPQLLILDEPTSALDRDSEAAVLETLEALKHRVALVIVSHRPQPLTVCDRVYVLHEGRLVRTRVPSEPRTASLGSGRGA